MTTMTTSRTYDAVFILPGSLAEDDLQCDIRPPQIHKADDGKPHAVHTASCISTAAGDFCLDVRLNPGK